MSSRIEEVIEEIEEYIEDCKFQPLSSTKIVVNKDELINLLEELKDRTPEEIRKYQKIISNKEAILADAQAKADAILEEAQIETNEMVNEHQIMQQAYAQANEIVSAATNQANEILDAANAEADELRMSAMSYVSGVMSDLEGLLSNGTANIERAYQSFIGNVRSTSDTVAQNHREMDRAFSAYTNRDQTGTQQSQSAQTEIQTELFDNSES